MIYFKIDDISEIFLNKICHIGPQLGESCMTKVTRNSNSLLMDAPPA